MTWDPITAGIGLGAANGMVLFVGSCIKRKAVDEAGVGLAAVVFLASYNLWPPLVLLQFAADPSVRNTLPAALRGYEIYLAVAAFCSFLLTVIGIYSSYVKAWKV